MLMLITRRHMMYDRVDIGLDHTWNIPDLPWKAFSNPVKKKKYYDIVTSLDLDLVDILKAHVEHVSPDKSVETKKGTPRTGSWMTGETSLPR